MTAADYRLDDSRLIEAAFEARKLACALPDGDARWNAFLDRSERAGDGEISAMEYGAEGGVVVARLMPGPLLVAFVADLRAAAGQEGKA